MVNSYKFHTRYGIICLAERDIFINLSRRLKNKRWLRQSLSRANHVTP